MKKPIPTPLAGAAVALLSVVAATVAGVTIGGSRSGSGASPAPIRVTAAAYQQSRCLDLPISSSLMSPTSCWSAGGAGMVIAGRSAVSGAGLVVTVGGGTQKIANVAGRGRLRIVAASKTGVCLEEGRGHYRYLHRGAGAAGPAANSCGTAKLAPAKPAQAPTTMARAVSVGLGPCTGVRVSSSPTAVAVGGTVTFLAVATCPASTVATFQFSVEASGSSQVVASSGWVASQEWAWSTAGYAAGAYELVASVTDAAPTNGPQDVAQTQVVVGVPPAPPPPCASTTIALSSATVSEGEGLSVTAAPDCSGGPPPMLAYIVVPAGSNSWVTASAWTPATTWQWVPAGVTPGYYDILVWATDGSTSAGPQVQAEATVEVTATPPPSPCNGVTLTPSAGVVAAGQSLTVTATPLCPAGSAAKMAYIVEPTSSNSWVTASAWTSGTSWQWTPTQTGDFQVLVWLTNGSTNNGPQAQAADVVSVGQPPSNPTCTGLSAAVSPDSGPSGSSFTAVATPVCPAGTQPMMAYIVERAGSNLWSTASAWTSATSWLWSSSAVAPGQYDLLIWATDGPTSDGPQAQAEVQINVSLSAAAIPCGSAGLQLAATDVGVGATVSVSAVSTCPSGSSPSFAYIVEPAGSTSWLTASAWTSSAWSWSTAGVSPGAYVVSVWVTDGILNAPQAVAEAQVEVGAMPTPAPPCSGLGLAANPSSGLAGMTVSVSATATCPAGAHPYLAYTVTPESGGSPIVTTAWTGSSWSWQTSGVAAGQYLLTAYLSDNSSNLTLQGAQAWAESSLLVNPGLVPAATTSYYEFAAYVGECPADPNQATSSCPLYQQGFAQRPVGAGGIVVLDFGAPCYVYGASTFIPGTQLFASATCTPDTVIQSLLEDWMAGYVTAWGQQAITLAAGTSNSLTGVDNGYISDANMSILGHDWFSDVVQPAAAWAAGRPSAVTVWGASDLEQSTYQVGGFWQWDTGENSMNWVDGYSNAASSVLGASPKCSTSQSGYLADYGDDVLMNPSTTTDNGWTALMVYQASWGLAATCALPEIYYSSMAQEWAALSSWAQGQSMTPIHFAAVMAEPNSPPELCTLASPCSATQGYVDLGADLSQGPGTAGLTQITSAEVVPPGAYPSVSAVAPAQGVVGGQVTIYGSDLGDVQAVYFGNVLASQFFVGGSTLTVTVPAQSGSTSTVAVILVSSTGSSPIVAADQFTYG